MRKRRKNKEKNSVNILIGFVCISMIVILLVLCVALYLIYFTNGVGVENTSEVAEASLLASGLAIIGVAISVWAGLNIIQVLEKDKLVELGRQVSEYKHERYVHNKTLFLTSVASELNELNRYIYEKLLLCADEEEDEVTAEMYFELNSVEEMFQLVYKEQLLSERTLRNDYYDTAIEKCKQLEKQIRKSVQDVDVLLDYIQIRIFEFYFYKGYTKQSKDSGEARGCFQKVINGFLALFPDLEEPEKMVKQRKYINDSVLLTVYMLNTIGEAHSKIIETYKKPKIVTCCMREIAKDAQKYYEALILLIETDETVPKIDRPRLVRETYYRNYGVLLERISKNIEHNTKLTFVKNGNIQHLYQKAADIELCGKNTIPRYKAFYTLLSFYIKVMDNYEVVKLLEQEEHGLDFDQKAMREYTCEMLFYAEAAEHRYPSMNYFVKCKAFIVRDLTIWAIKEGDYGLAQTYFKQLQELLKDITRMDKEQVAFGEDYPDKMLQELNRNEKEIGLVIDSSKK